MNSRSTRRVIMAIIALTMMASGCIRNEYRLFRTDQNIMNDSIQALLANEHPVLTIRKNDILEVNVYSSKGERIIDPDLEYLMPSNSNSAMLNKVEQYIVQSDGTVFLPMVGRVAVEGLYLTEADSLLSVRYSSYYKDAYVKTRIINKRVIVIGPAGGKVIKLENEGVNLIEAMALYGGLNENMRTDKVRLIRGPLDNPDVQVIDLSTIGGMKQAQTRLLPGDIIYVEPIKRVYRETMTDILPGISLAVSLLTLLVLIANNNR